MPKQEELSSFSESPFAQEVNLYLAQHAPLLDHENPVYTPEAYFTMLLASGLEARERGNYGIAAVTVIRFGNTEILVFGQNELVTTQNPAGHAETNSLQRVGRLISSLQNGAALSDALHDPDLKDNVIVRTGEKPCEQPEVTLYTTLEPCPLCTVVITNAGINEVIWASDDTLAGAMHDDRLEKLPSLWPELINTQGLIRTSLEQAQDPQLLPELTDLLKRLFFENRESIDQQVAQGLLNLSVFNLLLTTN